jgi:hypothetical protein
MKEATCAYHLVANMLDVMSRTLQQRTNHNGWPKAGEMIEMSGTHPLQASDRALLNAIYQFAHDSGRMEDPTAEWEIPLAQLRQGMHESNDRIYESLQRLKRVDVTLFYYDQKNREERIMLTGLLDFVDISRKEFSRRATLRFGLPRKLVPMLAQSGRWGRIKAETVCAMSSKYAIALYEQIQLREHLERCVEIIPIDRFRDIMGVAPGLYENGTNFQRKVLEPALLEVNALSDMSVAIEVNRRHPRAPIEAVTITWWCKDGDEFREAIREQSKSKVGRLTRLRESETGKNKKPPRQPPLTLT